MSEQISFDVDDHAISEGSVRRSPDELCWAHVILPPWVLLQHLPLLLLLLSGRRRPFSVPQHLRADVTQR